jgi:uncharacterized protein YbjT (DUF2867 family)
MSKTTTKTALLFGATGLVGTQLLKQLLAHPAYGRVIAPGRHQPDLTHEKLDAPILDFNRLPLATDELKADDVFIALGTTIKRAGSQEAFRKVDFDFIVNAARTAKAGGAERCLLVSSAGADPDSRIFYSKVKGETEEAVKNIGFAATDIFRPGALVGEREEFRLGEKIGIGVSTFLRGISPAILGKYNPTDADVLAGHMIAAAREGVSGYRLHEAQELTGEA